MSESKRISLSRLEKAREQLRKAQSRVTALETQLFENQSSSFLPQSLEDRYHPILDNLIEGCQIIGFDWRYLYLNDAAAKQGLQEKSEMLGFTMMERYPGIEKTEIFNILQHCMQERTHKHVENRFTYPDGTTAWFELRIQPVHDGIAIFSLDISERKQAESTLHQNETPLRLFVEHAPAAIAMLDADMKYLLVSQRWLSDYRLGESDVIGRSHYDLFPDIPESWRAVHKRCLAGAVESSDADPFPRSDGRLDWVRWEIHPWRKNDGSIGGIFIFSEVITERKEAEEALQHYAQRMEILHQIDKGIINANSIREVVENALKYIRRLIPCQRANVGLIDMTKGEGVIFAVDYDADSALGQGLRVPIRQDFFDGYDDKHVKVVPDLRVLQETNPRFKQAVNEGLLSGLNVILLDHDVPIGTLGLFATTPNFFTAEHQQVIVEVGNQLALAIRQMHLSNALTHQLETLNQTREFLQTTLDAFPANTTVLDPDGNIVAVNLSWKQFADLNSGDADQYYLGKNYLEVCDETVGLNADEAEAAAEGIRAVISGDLPTFQLEYPCHSLTQKRWFVLRVTSFDEQAPRRVVVAHIDITERKQAEAAEHEQRLLAETLRDSLALLTTSLDVETVMHQILDYSAIVIPSEAGTIILFEGDHGRVAYSRGYSAEAEAFFKTNLIDLDSGMYGRSKESGAFYLAADTQSTPGWVAFPFTSWVRSSIGVQIVAQDKVIGLLIADSSTPNQFQHKDVENLQAFARYAALALENAYHVDQLEAKVEKRTADLQEAKERVEAILNNSPDGVLLIDADLNIQQTNASFHKIFSSQADDYYGNPLTALIHLEDVDIVKDTLQTILLEHQGKHLEIRARRKDGTIFDAEFSIGLIKNDGLVCLIRDITERKRLHRQLQYHASLQENVSDAVIVSDMELRIQTWNKAAVLTYGWTAEEAIGKVAPDFLNIRFPSPQAEEAGLEQFIKYGSVQQETIQSHRDGTDIFILGSATRLDDEKGVPIGVIAINRDITERKAQERQLRYHASIQASVSDAVIATDMDFRIQSWNRAAEIIYGWSAAEAIGKSVNEILHTVYESEADGKRIRQDFLEHGAWQGEVIQHHRDGSPINILASVNLFKDEAGQPFGVVSVNRDITERKRVAEALQKSALEIHDLYNNAPCGYHSIDKDGVVIQINDTELRWLGYNRDEVIGKLKIPDIFTQESVDTFRKAFPVFIEQGWINDLKFDVVRKDGSIMHILLNATAIYDEQGQFLRSRSILFDITERKAAEEALQIKVEDERQFQSYLKALHEIIIELTATDEPDAFYKRTVELGRERLGFDRLAMFLYDEQDGNAVGTFGTDAQGNLVDERGIRFKPSPNGVMQRSSERAERFCFDEQVTLYNNEVSVGTGWNAAAVLWNGAQSLGWLVADNLLSHAPASKSLLDIIGLYALSIGTLLAQKQTQLALRKNEALYRLLADNINDLIMRSTLTSECLYISPSVQVILGYTPEELIGQQTFDLIHPDDKPTMWDTYGSALEQNKLVMSHQYRAKHKDGHYIWLETVGKPIFSEESNEIYGVITSSRDVTQRKQAEDAVRQSEARYRLLAENLADMIMTFSIDRQITYMSPSCKKLLGYLPEEVEGKSHSEFIHPEDYPGVIDKTRQAVAFKAHSYTNQFRLRHKMGHYIWYEVRTKLVWEPNMDNVVQFASVLRDITERKQAEDALRESEEKYRSLVETMRGGLAVFDTEFRLTYVNDRFCELLGYSIEEVIGKQPINFIDSVDLPLVLSHLDRRQNAESTSYEVMLRHKQGHQIYTLLSGSPLLNQQGEYNGSIVVATDISIQKQAEDTLRQALAKEKELGDLKTRFVSMASHEFRTPLATILALTETLVAYRHKMLDGQIDEKFSKIKAQIGHLKDIMEDVLLLSRMQSRRVEFNPVLVNIDALCRSVLDEFQSHRDVQYQLDYRVSGETKEIKLDRKLMRQIISNLVSNAIKYSPGNKPIQISLECSDESFILKVQDEGIGIPEADLQHLFDAFHRASNVGAISGTGLGLVIAKEAVELHGGSIAVDSQIGIGTTFTVHIPIPRRGDTEK